MPLFFMKAFLLCAVVTDKTKLDGRQCFISVYCVYVCEFVDNWANESPNVSFDLWPLIWQKAGGASCPDASVLFPQEHFCQRAEQRKPALKRLAGCSGVFRCGRARSADSFVDISYPIWVEMSSGRRIKKLSDLLHHFKKIPVKNGCRICCCTYCKLDKESCHWFYILHFIWRFYYTPDDHINRLLYQLMNILSPPWNEQSARLLLLVPLICCKSWHIASASICQRGLFQGQQCTKAIQHLKCSLTTSSMKSTLQC